MKPSLIERNVPALRWLLVCALAPLALIGLVLWII